MERRADMKPRGARARARVRGAPPHRQQDLISQKVFTKSICESKFPHKFVNLFFMSVVMKDKLTDLCGS